MHRRKNTHLRLPVKRTTALAVGLVMAVIGGIIALQLTRATPSEPEAESIPPYVLPTSPVLVGIEGQAKVERFVDDAKRGIQWRGFRENPAGPCGHELLEAVDSQGSFYGCSHGPDPAPESVDARDPVQPLPPDQLASANNIVCQGDGKNGSRVQAMYIRAASTPSRYAQFTTSFQEYARRANTLIIESGYRSGEARSIRFVTDSGAANCKVHVPEVVIPDGSEGTYGDTVKALQQLGHTRPDRKYMAWIEFDYTTTGYCGWGGAYTDEKPGQDNAANSGPSYGLTGSGCWGHGTEAHELLHNMGAVQKGAPNSDGGAHCVDEWDRMCQNTEPGVTLRYLCNVSQRNLFDCNGDDYFNTNSTLPTNHYLHNHWNTANSAFFIRGGNPPRDTVKPAAPTFYKIKANDVLSGTKQSVMAQAEDNVGISKVTFQVDNDTPVTVTTTLMGTNGEPTTSYYGVNYDTTKLTNGAHTIKVTAYDLNNYSASSSISVTVQNSTTPPPTTPPPTTPPPTTPPPTTPPPTNPPKKGDLNNDTRVNLTDLSMLLSNWGRSGVPADLNTSGKVDLADLSLLLSNWAK